MSKLLALSDYGPHIEEFTSHLIDRLRKDDGKPVPLFKYCTYYSYDVMSVLAFNKPMGLLSGKSTDVVDSILKAFSESLDALGMMYHVPWFMNAITILTSFTGPLKVWTKWSQQQMKERLQVSPM